MDLQVSGLVSGFDWKTMVDQLSDVERAPQKRLLIEKHNLQMRNNALTDLQSNLSKLQDYAEVLAETTFFDRRTVASSAQHTTATAAAGTAGGKYNFEIFQLASTAKQTGVSDVGKSVTSGNSLATAGFGITITEGTFTVAGNQVAIETTDTLDSVVTTINNLSNISASYNSTTDKITISTTDSSTLVLGSANDTSNFLEAAHLVNNGTTSISSSHKIGGINLSDTVSSANFTAGAAASSGSFTVNGKTISYTSTSTVSDVLTAIDNSEANVSASYDVVNDRFVLTNKNEGDTGIALTETSGDFLAKTKLLTSAGGSLARGKNLIYRMNSGDFVLNQGNTITSATSGVAGLKVTASEAAGGAQVSSINTSSNTVTTSTLHGYSTGDPVEVYTQGTIPGGLSGSTTYYVKATSSTSFTLHTTTSDASNGTNAVSLTSSGSGDVYFLGGTSIKAAVTVGQDTDKIKTSIQDFVDQYNKTQSLITTQTRSSTDANGKVTKGLLANDVLVADISRNLRSKTTGDVTGITGDIKRLESLGYKTSGYSNQVTLDDSDTLDESVRDKIGEVKNLFTTATYGLGVLLNSYMEELIGDQNDKGDLVDRKKTLTEQSGDIDDKVKEMERRVQSNRDLLVRSFVAMEQAQAKINQQMSFLMQRFK